MLYLLVYTAAVAFSVPGAALLTMSGGFLFGALLGGSASLCAATLGAIVVFLIAKTAFGSLLVGQERLKTFRQGFHKDAFNYLLFLRLVPVFPFWLVNVAPALMQVPLRTYIAATFLGILPGTFAFAFFGSGLGSVFARQQTLYETCLAGAAPESCVFEFSVASFTNGPFLLGLVALGGIALVPVVLKRWRSTSET